MPPNIPAIAPVKVYLEIWLKLQTNTQSRDLRLQRIQTKSLASQAYVVDGRPVLGFVNYTHTH